jgi:hypothetical protein
MHISCFAYASASDLAPSANAVFEYADEHKHYLLRFDAILYAEIVVRKKMIKAV